MVIPKSFASVGVINRMEDSVDVLELNGFDRIINWRRFCGNELFKVREK